MLDRSAYPDPRHDQHTAPKPLHDEAGKGFLAGLFSMRMDKSRQRLIFVALIFLGLYGAIASRLVHYARNPETTQVLRRA